MKFDLDTLRSVTLGAVRVEETDEGFRFHRFTEEQEALYREKRPERQLVRCFFDAGVRFSFDTDSETLYLKGDLWTVLSERRLYSFDLLVNGVLTDTVTNIPEDYDPHLPTAPLPVDSFEKTFALGKGKKRVDLHLPWSSRVTLKEMSLGDGASLSPVRPEKKLICFGDSITQGYDAQRPSGRYAAILARALGAEEFNKGIGGEVFFPELAALRDPFDPDYITVAYGTNDFSRLEPEKFRENCLAFFRTLSENYPSAKIFAVSPIWRKAYRTHPTTKFSDYFEIENGIRAVAEDLPNVTFIPGFDLVPHDPELLSDRSVHPWDAGFAHYGKNLSAAILARLG